MAAPPPPRLVVGAGAGAAGAAPARARVRPARPPARARVRPARLPARVGAPARPPARSQSAVMQTPAWAKLKALVCFWIIDETLVLTSMLSVCRLNEVGTCQVMEQVMIMVMMVMTTR